MRSFAFLALAAGALALPQGVTQMISPSATAPAGCMPTYPGSFEITVVNVTSSSKRSLNTRQKSGILTLKLAGGVLTDQADRTGYIAANYQFQFDSPPQTGALFTSGFSVCSNNSLALGGSAIFYQCYSGGFYNLYDRHWAPQCSPVYIVAMGGSAAITIATDGQPAATSAGVATVLTDGQPGIKSAATAFPLSQLTDGQPQVPTGMPVSQISDGQPQAPTGIAVSILSDGQPQVPTGVVVSILSDGQPQVPTSSVVAPVSLMSDGQIVATTAAPAMTSSVVAPVSLMSDGQIVATSAAPAMTSSPVTPLYPISTGAPASIITDGQVVVPSATISASANGTAVFTASPSQFTGGVGGVSSAVTWVSVMGAIAALLLS